LIKEKLEEKLKKIQKEEATPLMVGFITDWRVEDKYLQAMRERLKSNPYNSIIEARKDFLKNAINNRHNLKNIVIEPHEPNQRRPHSRIEIEVTDEEYMAIQADFQKAGLVSAGLDTYLRALYYSTAIEMIDGDNKKKLRLEESMRQRTLYNIEGAIDFKLRTLLIEKYSNDPSLKDYMNSNLNYSLYRAERILGDMLVLAAKELFGLK